MREQTLPRFQTQSRLLPGMLKRTKYTRLRNDSLASVEDRSPRMRPLKRDLCLASDFASLDTRMPSHHGSSTLRDFIPRVANLRLQSPMSLLGLRGHIRTDGARATDGHTVRPLSGAEWGSGSSRSFFSHPGQNKPFRASLCCTKRPVTVHSMASLPWTPGPPPRPEMALCRLAFSSAVEEAEVGTGSRAVHHHIKYMGSVAVTQSMRALDFDTRMQVTREAISRLCERTPTKTAGTHKKPVCKAVSAILGQTDLEFSGRGIVLTVSADSVTLIAASSLQVIGRHPMQAISFASGGDPDMEDYIAYVAKDLANQRACHILECPRGQAGEVIGSIGQAFETRFRHLLNHTPALLSPSPRSEVRLCQNWSPHEPITDPEAKTGGKVSGCHDYYNVIPGKMPPSGGTENVQLRKEKKQNDDFQEVCSPPLPVSLYENCSITDETPAPPADSVQPDVTGQCASTVERRLQDLIQGEGWFHGRLGRRQAESLLSCSGDFLVRESSSASGQYVLSGLEGATARHLLLVDPHGQVRTRDQVFLSVGHLVRFHMENQMPIISGSSELLLKTPILQGR